MRFYENEETNTDYIMFDRDVVLTMKYPYTAEDAITALDNKDNYGRYISTMRSSKVTEKDLDEFFGPRSPRVKAAREKELGKKFPIRTAQAIQDYINSRVSKPNLVQYEVQGDTLVFPKEKNQTRGAVMNIVKTVLENAGIDKKYYTIKQQGA